MKKLLATALLALTAISGTAFGQNVITTASAKPWDGFYVGGNLGGIWNSTCNTWTANTPTQQNILNKRECPNGGAFLGGIQLGYNFQYDQFVWGVGLDYEIVSSKSKSHTYTVPPVDAVITGGTFTTSGKTDSTGVLFVGPKFGYDLGGWLPYARVGAVHTSGSPSATATYVDNTNGTFTFNGGKNAKNSGWGAGAGVDWNFQDTWSAGLEYTYIDIGKSNSSTAFCSSTTPGACNIFNNYNLGNIHNSLTFSMVRLEINYYFGEF